MRWVKALSVTTILHAAWLWSLRMFFHQASWSSWELPRLVNTLYSCMDDEKLRHLAPQVMRLHWPLVAVNMKLVEESEKWKAGEMGTPSTIKVFSCIVHGNCFSLYNYLNVNFVSFIHVLPYIKNILHFVHYIAAASHISFHYNYTRSYSAYSYVKLPVLFFIPKSNCLSLAHYKNAYENININVAFFLLVNLQFSKRGRAPSERPTVQWCSGENNTIAVLRLTLVRCRGRTVTSKDPATSLNETATKYNANDS